MSDRSESGGAQTGPPPHDFAERIIRWQRAHGRHDLPWQEAEDGGKRNSGDLDQKAYRVWLSEIMLQQTQVATVIPYYTRFLVRFPSLQHLAEAPLDEVLQLWSGLGYYSRARNLHSTARRLASEFGGVFPRTVDGLRTLPGIGRSTAGAIAALAFGVGTAILDANVRRVLSRAFGFEGVSTAAPSATEKRLWLLAEALLPETGVAAYTQGLMDLGATICTPRRPRCQSCPVADGCTVRAQGGDLGFSAALSAPKRKAPRPERAIAMVLLRHSDRIWLNRRAPTGIWGGLWSLPELPAPGAAAAAYRLAEEHGRVERVESLARFTHGFTHFKLHVEVFQAVMADLRGCDRHTAHDSAADGRWIELNDAPGAALPSPVKRLLLDLAAGRAVRAAAARARQNLPCEAASGAVESSAGADSGEVSSPPLA